ncbi:hypothetical protein GCM10010404_26580 [Nonomuraea africana]|uniref:Aminoglycoside phosphotransferase domain-containing protein n=1 Tax=Nonomuraea africana TaxID=46171 RepID=A0ABR9KN82_9ACTN|nr:hypothetical protein [Nonomuraea africana]MBE1563479.1 hypothetical protein [Nonomuraea africana]
MSVPDLVAGLAARHGLRVKDPVVLHDSYNMRIHLRPHPVVARVATVTSVGRPRPAEALAREVSVASFLAAGGEPVVPPTDLMPPDPFSHAGLDASFWQFVRHDADSPAFLAARRLQGILWTLAKPKVFPEFAGRAQAVFEEWLNEHPA